MAIHALRLATAEAGLGDPVAVVFGPDDRSGLRSLATGVARLVSTDAQAEHLTLLGVALRAEETS